MTPEIAEDIRTILEYIEPLDKCEHQCTSNCRREGCNCECGEFHILVVEAADRIEAFLATYQPNRSNV
jgi:hypothetical protein